MSGLRHNKLLSHHKQSFSIFVRMLSNMKAVFIDLSGTLHIEDDPTHQAVNALNKLREKTSLRLLFVTNTTKESKNYLLKRLRKIGFDIASEEIFSSLSAARRRIDQCGLRPLLMIDEKAKEDFDGVATENPNAVLVGLAPDLFNYESLNQAMRLIQNGADLIAIHKAKYYKRSDGLALGPGPFVAALEYATGAAAVVVGKPEADFFQSAAESIGVSLNDCIMIGDDVQGDVEGAQNVGMRGILVKTGKYIEGDERKINSAPYLVAENFFTAVQHILDNS